ncbi:hypothetical protein DUI87_00562 [Hirundo rustica rustica]|uniref:ribonuclease H n=1 Tax=Hirundo rustica rustica TaxID=333673 RepID=A0A3M0LAV7_HIRRU|nr:hypothetical protein DUI87_00562 [Hirundo rustica rustica]
MNITGLLDTGVIVTIVSTRLQGALAWERCHGPVGVTIDIPDASQNFRAAATEKHPTQKLNWKTDAPLWVEQCPLSKQKLKALHELVEGQLKKGNIEETMSPWNSPGFVIQKADKNKWWLLHDLRQINSVMEDMGSLQPGMLSPIMLPRNWRLAVIDIKDCFSQIPLHPDDAPRFSFSVPTINREAPRKCYHWHVLPQGMKNSQMICQWYVASLLSPVHAAAEKAITTWMMSLLCAPNDDVLTHALDLTIVAGLKLQESKVQRMPPRQYLGLEISKWTIVPQKLAIKKKIRTLIGVHQLCGALNWPLPLDKSQETRWKSLSWLGDRDWVPDPGWGRTTGEKLNKALISPRSSADLSFAIDGGPAVSRRKEPPFYEGVALDVPFEYSAADNPHNCKWDTPRREITLSQVTGRGKGFGNVTLAKQMGNICAEFIQPSRKTDKWAVPFVPGMWVCQQIGITPCVYLSKFNNLADFCVQVLIVPRVLYHQEEEMYHFLEETIQLHKREVMTGITIAMLLGLGAASTATGVSALMTQHQGLSQLQMTIDEALLRIEKSISSLEESISSLSEVVLQNRRGLDLLLMQQGGLCAALREECCFYADHTGVMRDSMAELRERVAQRKREREAQQGWFKSWFNQSPWLATLVSTLIGPLTMILLVLIFGPCILNKSVSFARSRLEKVDILFVQRLQLS